jgi:two-component system LytT family sensor kinase
LLLWAECVNYRRLILIPMNRTEKIIRHIAGSFLLRNLILFILVLSINISVTLALGQMTPKTMLIEAILLTNSYGSFLFHNLVLYRYLLKPGRYVIYAISVIALLMVSSRIYHGMKWILYHEPSDFPWQKWVAMYWVELMYYWASLCVYLAYIYYRDRERLFRVEQEKKELELRQLNEQLNPHFLFNALNNIYSYLLTQSTAGRELILKLSELMRYVLDSSKKSQASLEEEIDFIEHYIAFEKERLGDRCTVEYKKKIDTEEACIIPLILFTFIENAFKHGTASMRPSRIQIEIHADKSKLHIFVCNAIHKAGNASTHTGLENTRRRLELLYPGQYELDIRNESGNYSVNLKLFDLKCRSAA